MNQERNLFSGVLDFLLLGGISIFILPLMYLAFPPNESVDPQVFQTAIFISLILDYVVNFPHFAYSYQLFYHDISRKLRGETDPTLQKNFFFAGIFIPITLVIFFVYGAMSENVSLLAWAVNLRLLTFGWHYAKQGFGIFVLLSKYKKFEVTAFERGAILLNTHLAWIYAWVLFNTEEITSYYFGVSFKTFSLPQQSEIIILTLLIISSLFALGILVGKYLKLRTLPPMNGLLAYIAAAYIWIFYRFSLGESRGAAIAFILAPFFHSLQYFVVVQRLKLNEIEMKGLAKAHHWRFVVIGLGLGALGFTLFPRLLNSFVPYNQSILGNNFFMFVFWSFINIHHFFIDNVIWRRESSSVRQFLDQR